MTLTENAMMERYYNMQPHEQQIIRSAAKDKDPLRGMSLCRLYFAGAADETILKFMSNLRKSVAL